MTRLIAFLALGLIAVLRLQQQSHLHRRQPDDLEALLQLQVVGAGGPGEAMDVRLDEAVGDLAVEGGRLGHPSSGGADDEALGQGEANVVGAEV